MAGERKYKYRGAWYLHDGSAEADRWEAEGARPRRSPRRAAAPANNTPQQPVGANIVVADPASTTHAIEDDEERCNDQPYSSAVAQHDETVLCAGKNHSGRAVRTCKACCNAAFAQTSAQQQNAVTAADHLLCVPCGEERLTVEKEANQCLCLDKPLCGQCLIATLNEMNLLAGEVSHKECYDCTVAFKGDERVQMCLVCMGLKLIS
ncbi:hypothetical protein LTR49_026142 [Elasticomyces elasticus]|nr:hypothetical protein LTR49_026142 [Elasticomyces elasticus]KAK5739618.1 hypothetical protein LTS12_025208 [Elasticomyces elasticus]